jgi:hypothetical protein
VAHLPARRRGAGQVQGQPGGGRRWEGCRVGEPGNLLLECLPIIKVVDLLPLLSSQLAWFIFSAFDQLVRAMSNCDFSRGINFGALC